VSALGREGVTTTSRVATPDDLDGLTATLTAAFQGDPLWSWAFREPEKLAVWWRFLIESALRYPWTWISGDYAAASVWIPFGGTELTAEEQTQVEPLLTDLVGHRASGVMEMLDRFEDFHPRDELHYYLSLLGTHPEHRGGGVGMALLADNLARIDTVGMAAYLESSNPANDKRYERLGFVRTGDFSTPDGSCTVTTMWRDGR
jgi:GNAT superfamily N-acetyltransferase